MFCVCICLRVRAGMPSPRNMASNMFCFLEITHWRNRFHCAPSTHVQYFISYLAVRLKLVQEFPKRFTSQTKTTVQYLYWSFFNLKLGSHLNRDDKNSPSGSYVIVRECFESDWYNHEFFRTTSHVSQLGKVENISYQL